MGGGGFVVPVQTVPDFLEKKMTGRMHIIPPELFYFTMFLSLTVLCLQQLLCHHQAIG